ncbi:hypothetical protein SEA_LUCKYSOCKE_20 [Streptomyces phage LuckySocke]|jgi:hypothetical protein|nr:hypothetical protein SEA_LUCKYSOCKE_20 [Streptomyces phage LuckySocke]
MGYYSSFEVLDTDIENIAEELSDISGYHFTQYFQDGSVQMSDCGKWYDWEDDLKTLARMYPTRYAVLERRGEESPDIERAIVYKGEVHMQSPEIRFPYFDSLPDLDTVVKAR